MNPVCMTGFKAVFVAVLCLGLDAFAASAEPKGETVAANAANAEQEKQIDAVVGGEDGAADVKSANDNRPGRNAELAQIDAVAAKIEIRKQAIIAENEAAAKINGEIEAMAREVQKIVESMKAKEAELGKILETDKTMLELNQEMATAYESLRKAQAARREQGVRSHREHLMLPVEAPTEASAAKAGEGK